MVQKEQLTASEAKAELETVKTTNSQLEGRVVELEAVVEKNAADARGNRATLIAEVENRLSSAEEELKIRDELLAESEQKMTEFYELKYEMADLKEKMTDL